MEGHFSCSAAGLKRALAFTSSLVERRNVIPILGMVRIQTTDHVIHVHSTDLDAAAVAEVELCEKVGNMDFTMNPMILRQILTDLPADALVEFARLPRDPSDRASEDLIQITADCMTARMRVLCPSSEWPSMVFGNLAGMPAAVAEGQLREALEAAWPCVSTEETRYYLNGVFLHDRGKGLLAVATDGHRLARFESGIGWGLPDAIWPRRTLALLMSQLKRGGNDQLTICADDRRGPTFQITAPAWRLTFKTIDGTFPDYNRVIPTWDPQTTATLTATAIRRVPCFGERQGAIALDTSIGTISARAPNLGMEVTIPLQSEGAPLRIGFDRGYLARFTAQSGTIKLEMNGAGEPARVLSDDPRLLRVLMPMRL